MNTVREVPVNYQFSYGIFCMDTVENLEESVRRLIETGRKLRQERDAAVNVTENIRRELVDARETITGLKRKLEQSGKSEERLSLLDLKKTEIIGRLQLLESQLETYIDIENSNITNDPD
jgi:uncharacterized protein (DUF1786 family)